MNELYFISKGLPNLIKSAGDIRAYNMLKILRKKFYIHAFARSADFGDADVKGLGCEAHITGDPQNTIKICLKDKSPDVVILSHWTVAKEMIEYVRRVTNAKVFIDTIDLEFLRLTRKLEFDPSSIDQKEVDRVKENELAVYRKADGLIVASEQDREELMKYYDFKTIYLPCLFSINNAYHVNNGKNVYIICNWTHDPNIVSTKYLCEKIVPNVDVLFYVVGKHPPEEIRKFESSRVTISGAEYEINKFLSKMNMLLCPVFYGAGMNGKIGESLAYGIPVVTTTMGARPFSLIHRETCMIGDSDEKFIECVKELLNNVELRSRLSVNGRQLMKKYTVEFFQDCFCEKVEQT